jgi:hypothetical protein
MSSIESAATVDDVSRLFQQCLDTARAENSADGYFPLIYIWVTRDILAEAQRFESPEVLRRMTVVFANRYFSARRQFRAGEPASRTWSLTFQAARTSPALVVQHILLAMNAHINVDLGVAVAETELSWADFSRVDRILGAGIDRTQSRLNRTTRLLSALDVVAGGFDEMFASFSLSAARRHAFDLAQRLRATPPAARPAVIAEAEDLAHRLGQRLLSPPSLRDRLLLAAMRLSERNLSPRELLALLERA